MAAPPWFKERKGKCVIHGCEYLEFNSKLKKKRGLKYCPECRLEAIKAENERKRIEAENSNSSQI